MVSGEWWVAASALFATRYSPFAGRVARLTRRSDRGPYASPRSQRSVARPWFARAVARDAAARCRWSVDWECSPAVAPGRAKARHAGRRRGVEIAAGERRPLALRGAWRGGRCAAAPARVFRPRRREDIADGTNRRAKSPQLGVQPVALVLRLRQLVEDARADGGVKVGVDLALHLGGDGVARELVRCQIGMGLFEGVQRALRDRQLGLDAYMTRGFTGRFLTRLRGLLLDRLFELGAGGARAFRLQRLRQRDVRIRQQRTDPRLRGGRLGRRMS